MSLMAAGAAATGMLGAVCVPHVVPGASVTQWYWASSYDLTTADPDFER
jgi:hypothetical protein